MIILITTVFYIKFKPIFLQPLKSDAQEIKFGIIDGSLTLNYDNIVIYNKSGGNSIKTHGDNILNFMHLYAPQYSMYYYNAEKDGGISSYEILNGLNWMLENGVEYVSISLSSKYYSNELQQWITAHSDEITIFASYNNTINTLDYPAKYKNLKGVYSSTNVEAKSIDVFFRSNNIILISDGIHFYRGNSYLSPYAMIQYATNDM